ncbi:thermonuclease family protein [Primorskyibacter sp. S87]|uniref:thermonuclease family protein n=1 Tax=Primorskyibacter sp. S87 TaxID=3415126 RepID=UPI003C7CF1C3
MARKGKVIRFSRGYRKTPKWGMGLPPKAPTQRQRDPTFYLQAVMVLGASALVLVQLLPDFAVAGRQMIQSDGCRIVSVTDGDTVRLWCPSRGTMKARLLGFDTPEVFSPECPSEFVRGTAATWFLRYQLIRAEETSVVLQGSDRYQRRLAAVYVDGKPLSQVMIHSGHGRPYSGGKRKGWCG